jgi:hypothetical protein
VVVELLVEHVGQGLGDVGRDLGRAPCPGVEASGSVESPGGVVVDASVVDAATVLAAPVVVLAASSSEHATTPAASNATPHARAARARRIRAVANIGLPPTPTHRGVRKAM